MNAILESLAASPEMFVGLVLSLAGMILVGFVGWIIGGSIVRSRRETEQSRREIAAYVAEGSITAEDAESILAPRPWYARSGEQALQDWRQGACKKPRAARV